MLLQRSFNFYNCLFLVCISLMIFTSGCTVGNPAVRDYVYQVSTLNALKEGNYDGTAEIGELTRHGDHGVGTFNAIDGEMIIHNGVVYKAELNGDITRPEDSEKTPFAVVTGFRTDYEIEMTNTDCGRLKSDIERSFTNKKQVYAVKVSGQFDHLKIRSVRKQERPFPPLSKVIEDQNVMEEENISGTAVGYWFPGELGGVNEAGFHLHFINRELSRGGHILDCNMKSGVVYIDGKNELLLTIQSGKKGEL